MQFEMPDALNLDQEPDETLGLYGLKRGQTDGFGWQCLAARRLVERGVRFVELIHSGSSGNWDSHGDMADHGRLAPQVDKPIAGLLQDLKRRGLMDEVLVVWTTEFGRTPFNNTADNKGREHHNWAFTSWLAGAGGPAIKTSQTRAGTVPEEWLRGPAGYSNRSPRGQRRPTAEPRLWPPGPGPAWVPPGWGRVRLFRRWIDPRPAWREMHATSRNSLRREPTHRTTIPSAARPHPGPQTRFKPMGPTGHP